MRLKVLLLAATLFLGSNSFAKEQQEVKPKQQQATQNYDFSFPDSNGKMINITASQTGLIFKESKGKVILLNFFGSKCPPCLMEIPHLVKIQDKYKGNFEIVALQVQKQMGNEKLNQFIEDKKINYKAADYSAQMGPFIDFIMQATGWKGMIPYMLLFDQNGRVVQTPYVGMVSEDVIKADIEKLLQPKKKI